MDLVRIAQWSKAKTIVAFGLLTMGMSVQAMGWSGFPSGTLIGCCVKSNNELNFLKSALARGESVQAPVAPEYCAQGTGNARARDHQFPRYSREMKRAPSQTSSRFEWTFGDMGGVDRGVRLVIDLPKGAPTQEDLERPMISRIQVTKDGQRFDPSGSFQLEVEPGSTMNMLRGLAGTQGRTVGFLIRMDMEEGVLSHSFQALCHYKPD